MFFLTGALIGIRRFFCLDEVDDTVVYPHKREADFLDYEIFFEFPDVVANKRNNKSCFP